MKKFFKFIIASVTLAAVGAVVIGSQARAATTLITESFNGTSTQANQWLHGGNSVCITAGDATTPATSVPACGPTQVDPTGSGVLRLTNNANNREGFVILNTPISSSQGFRAVFDMYQYNSGTNHADGIGFIIIDGSKSPVTSGGIGPALGYGYSVTNRASGVVTAAGILGGYAGIGFDAYGNYSVQSCNNANYPSSGCTGFSPNTIGIRGSEGAQYQFVSNKVATKSIGVQTATRGPAKRTVTVTVSPSQIMNVLVDYHDGNGSRLEMPNINLATINGAAALPSTFKIGFSASTGGQVDFHEIQSLSIETLDPDLSVSVTAPTTPVKQGETAIFTAVVSNDPNAAPTTGVVTTTVTLPDGVVPQLATGNGWTCSVAGQVVTCTRLGDGANAIGSGESAPEITITTKAQVNAPTGEQTVHTSVATVGDTDASNNTDTATFEVVITEQPLNPEAPNTGLSTMNMAFGALAVVIVVAALGVSVRKRLLQN